MKKKKKLVLVDTVTDERNYEITEASLKDDFCHYAFMIKKGVGAGDEHKVKGKGIADDDLIDAIRRFNVHLACIDDVFDHSGTEIESIDKMENHPLTALYMVTGFKIKSQGDSDSVVLIGTKAITNGGRIDIMTPKIPLDGLSSYPWYNELKEVTDNARREVELYKEGKCVQVEEKEDPAQLKITVEAGADEEFENARL